MAVPFAKERARKSINSYIASLVLGAGKPRFGCGIGTKMCGDFEPASICATCPHHHGLDPGSSSFDKPSAGKPPFRFRPVADIACAWHTATMTTIYMALLNEGSDVWRPVEAILLPAGTYQIEGEMPDDEEWAFLPGTVVRCEWKTCSGGERGLTAIGLAD